MLALVQDANQRSWGTVYAIRGLIWLESWPGIEAIRALLEEIGPPEQDPPCTCRSCVKGPIDLPLEEVLGLCRTNEARDLAITRLSRLSPEQRTCLLSKLASHDHGVDKQIVERLIESWLRTDCGHMPANAAARIARDWPNNSGMLTLLTAYLGSATDADFDELLKDVDWQPSLLSAIGAFPGGIEWKGRTSR